MTGCLARLRQFANDGDPAPQFGLRQALAAEDADLLVTPWALVLGHNVSPAPTERLKDTALAQVFDRAPHRVPGDAVLLRSRPVWKLRTAP